MTKTEENLWMLVVLSALPLVLVMLVFQRKQGIVE